MTRLGASLTGLIFGVAITAIVRGAEYGIKHVSVGGVGR